MLAFAREGYRCGRARPGDLLGLLGYRGFWRWRASHWRTGAGEVYRSLSASARSCARCSGWFPSSPRRPGAGRQPACAPRRSSRDGTLVDDFRIVDQPDAIHVLNAPSPAATASLAIGRHIAGMAAKTFALR